MTETSERGSEWACIHVCSCDSDVRLGMEERSCRVHAERSIPQTLKRHTCKSLFSSRSSSCFERSCSCSCCRCWNRWVPNSSDCRLRSSLVCSSRYRLCESWVSCSRDNVLCSSLVCSSCARRHSEDCSEHARQSFCSQPYPLPTRSFVMYV